MAEAWREPDGNTFSNDKAAIKVEEADMTAANKEKGNCSDCYGRKEDRGNEG